MGLFSRAKTSLGIDATEERDAHDERWGRIVAIDSKLGPAVTLHLELHLEEQPLETIKLSTNAPLRRTPRVGDDVAIVPTEGGYRIRWGEPPQYGIPTPTPAEAVEGLGHLADDSFELDLQRRGTAARATVVALPEPVPDDGLQLRMPLDVEPPGGGPSYRVACVFPAARPVDKLAVGNWIPIKVDPDDRERVAVVWNLWLADLGRPPRRG